MTRFLSLSVLSLVFLAGCQSSERTTTDDDMMGDDPMMNDGQMDDGMMADDMAATVTPEGTVDAVQRAGGLTRLAVPAAIDNIDGWIARLEGDAQFRGVVTDLRTLRGQLQRTPIDGEAVGETLQDLGAATTQAAPAGSSLATLGRTLSEAGDQLSM